MSKTPARHARAIIDEIARLADVRRKLIRWRYDYNTVRPYSALNGQSPATARCALEQ
jgi:transposase InsO family protein